MNTLELMRRTNPLCSPAWTFAGRRSGELLFRLPPLARVRLEGLENLPKGQPCIISPNHTHKFDFFPIRCALLRHGQQLMTWVKARDYRRPAMRWILGKGGNIPLVSRGFLIATDFVAVHGRRPDEPEYRLLRRHVDEGAPLDGELHASLQRPRRIGGVAVAFGGGYREALRQAYRVLMEETLRLARQGRDRGRHQHIYPQGATSRQLTRGHPGVIQAALALRLPIVPVGMSGCREVFLGRSHPFTRGGEVVVRIGKALAVDPAILPESFRPFHPDDEDRHQKTLQAETDRLMAEINALCEPAYRWADDGVSDAKQGLVRFYD